MSRRIPVAKKESLPPGSMLRVATDIEPIMVCNVKGKLYAMSDTCTHAHASLASGYLEGTVIECAWHGAKFDVQTGRVVALPAARSLTTYPVHSEGDMIVLEIPEKEKMPDAAESPEEKMDCACGGRCTSC